MKNLINKIHHADCMQFLKQLPDNSIDCILTDVPYKQNYSVGKNTKRFLFRPSFAKISEYGSNAKLDYTEFFDLCLKKLKRVNFFTFCDKETKFDFMKMAKERGFAFEEIPFCKTSPAPFSHNQWLPDKEWGLHIYKNLSVMGSYETKRAFSIVSNLREPNVDHPTPKRVSEVIKILKNITNENDLVLDTYSGSGTTAVACYKLKRRFICIEKDEKYYKDSCERLANLQSQQRLF